MAISHTVQDSGLAMGLVLAIPPGHGTAIVLTSNAKGRCRLRPYSFARETYSPERVSTLISSPI